MGGSTQAAKTNVFIWMLNYAHAYYNGRWTCLLDPFSVETGSSYLFVIADHHLLFVYFIFLGAGWQFWETARNRDFLLSHGWGNKENAVQCRWFQLHPGRISTKHPRHDWRGRRNHSLSQRNLWCSPFSCDPTGWYPMSPIPMQRWLCIPEICYSKLINLDPVPKPDSSLSG